MDDGGGEEEHNKVMREVVEMKVGVVKRCRVVELSERASIFCQGNTKISVTRPPTKTKL